MTGKWFWLTGKGMTVAVGVDPDGIIFHAPPIVRKFIGQPLANLERWLRFTAVLLSDDPALD